MEFTKDRRLFLQTAAKLGLSAGAFLIFDAACSFADPTQSPSLSTPTLTPQISPTSIPFNNPTPRKPTPSDPPPTPYNAPTPTREAVIATPQINPVLPDDIITSPRVRMGHLLRRAGFGATRQEIDEFMGLGEEATISFLLDYHKVDDTDVENRIENLNLDPSNKLLDLQRMAIMRMIYTNRPLQEKMVLFWHGLLTSGWKKVGKGPYMLAQDELFRNHAIGPYDDFLKAVAKDSAMLIWLDSRVNKKQNPNENFARELMELFSMGVGTFTEDDVKESARAFTGWSLKKKVFFFQENQHDFGLKTFLENTGPYDGTDIVDIIMEQPATSLFVSRKLFEFFAYDRPDMEVISRLAKTFNETGYSIRAVVEQILKSDEFYSHRSYRSIIKSPAELVAGTIRTLGIETTASNGVTKYTRLMGQELFSPFDVSGWPKNAEWINSSTLLNRLNFMNAVAIGQKHLFDYDLVKIMESANVNTTEHAVDYLLDLLLDGEVSEEERSIYIAYLDGLVGSGNSVNKLTFVNKERLASLVYLVMSSPDYQLA